MREKFVFVIQPVSIEEGFTVECEGVTEAPVSAGRLFEAVVLATQLGKQEDFEIQIFDTRGRAVEVIAVHHPIALAA